jgi:SAM-dependent methyltransferase
MLNGVRKVAAGLRPFNESVWPGVRNDLFVAHESIYAFAASYATSKRVLDAGCGTGYGSALLAKTAEAVVGIDIDRKSVAYATRHFAAENLHFNVGNLERLTYAREFDLVVASNSLEHLHDPEAFFAGAKRSLRPNGVVIVAVPPIYSAHDIAAHGDIQYHRSNLSIREWHSLISCRFDVSCFVHVLDGDGVNPVFASPSPSRLTSSDFAFLPVSLPELSSRLSITAVFVGIAPTAN